MIIPFQMVMFTMSKMANILHLDNPIGIIVLYLGFGAGLSVFIFSGFVKKHPAGDRRGSHDGRCNPLQLYFLVVFPVLNRSLLLWPFSTRCGSGNDYLLPYLVIGNKL